MVTQETTEGADMCDNTRDVGLGVSFDNDSEHLILLLRAAAQDRDDVPDQAAQFIIYSLQEYIHAALESFGGVSELVTLLLYVYGKQDNMQDILDAVGAVLGSVVAVLPSEIYNELVDAKHPAIANALSGHNISAEAWSAAVAECPDDPMEQWRSYAKRMKAEAGISDDQPDTEENA